MCPTANESRVDRRVAELEAQVAELRARVARLQSALAAIAAVTNYALHT